MSCGRHLQVIQVALGAKAQQALSRGRQMRWDQSVGLALRAVTIARNRPGLAAA
jgi:hypothetical protein